MKNDNMKKNGQFPNVRVEYGFGAVCRDFHKCKESDFAFLVQEI